MNILIVDDEPLSVDSIASSLHWEEIGISTIHKAYSMKQAQAVFSNTIIDILLCDIEMPRGSGISLMEWIRAEGYSPVCIFLTSFSRFEYASSAVRLQMFDYVLKPCEYSALEDVISRAVKKRQEDLQRKEKEEMGVLWSKDYQNRLANFWYSLLRGNIPSDEDALLRECANRGIKPETLGHSWYIMLLRILPRQEMDSIWKNAVKNIIVESMKPACVLVDSFTFIVVTADVTYNDFPDYSISCRHMVKSLHSLISGEYIAHITPACPIGQAVEVFQQLTQDVQEKYTVQTSVFISGQDEGYTREPGFSVQEWTNALLSRDPEPVLENINRYLTSIPSGQYITRDRIREIHDMLMDAVYGALSVYRNQEHKEVSGMAADNYLNSIPDFLLWVKNVTNETVNRITSKNSTATAVDVVIRYIHDNLGNELSRSELMDVVHLHPDYLSALFRQETGISLTKYITQERINGAKNLLIATDLPISEIATRNGFQSIAYFSKQFKNQENMTPSEYRKKFR